MEIRSTTDSTLFYEKNSLSFTELMQSLDFSEYDKMGYLCLYFVMLRKNLVFSSILMKFGDMTSLNSHWNKFAPLFYVFHGPMRKMVRRRNWFLFSNCSNRCYMHHNLTVSVIYEYLFYSGTIFQFLWSNQKILEGKLFSVFWFDHNQNCTDLMKNYRIFLNFDEMSNPLSSPFPLKSEW